MKVAVDDQVIHLTRASRNGHRIIHFDGRDYIVSKELMIY